MAQPPSGGVIVSDEAARIAAGRLILGDEVVVTATVAEFMAGDSRVMIRTGRRNNGSSFWVPTLDIYPRAALLLGIGPFHRGDIPDYNVLDALRHAGVPYWDWRR
jgi:hypothetical protein